MPLYCLFHCKPTHPLALLIPRHPYRVLSQGRLQVERRVILMMVGWPPLLLVAFTPVITAFVPYYTTINHRLPQGEYNHDDGQ